MIKQLSAAVLATAGIVAGSIGPASAASVTSGAYTQVTRPLQCTGQVQGDGDGGTLYVEVSGFETRASDQHFRTYRVNTVVRAQEKTYDGTWLTVASGHYVHGVLGPSTSDDAGTTNAAPFVWYGDSSPVLSVSVAGFDDLFRAKVVSRVYDDEGVLIRTLVTYQGQCRL